MFSSAINVFCDLHHALQPLFDSTWVHRNIGSRETPGSLLSVHLGLCPEQRVTNYKRSDYKSRLKGDESAESSAAGCVFCQLSVWLVWYCTLFILVITLQRLFFHVRTPLAIQHFHSLSTVDTPYSLFGLCTGCEQSFCVLLLCYILMSSMKRNFAWGFFF